MGPVATCSFPRTWKKSSVMDRWISLVQEGMRCSKKDNESSVHTQQRLPFEAIKKNKNTVVTPWLRGGLCDPKLPGLKGSKHVSSRELFVYIPTLGKPEKHPLKSCRLGGDMLVSRRVRHYPEPSDPHVFFWQKKPGMPKKKSCQFKCHRHHECKVFKIPEVCRGITVTSTNWATLIWVQNRLHGFIQGHKKITSFKDGYPRAGKTHPFQLRDLWQKSKIPTVSLFHPHSSLRIMWSQN